MLSPPSAKKLSSMPTRSTPSTSANSPHSTSSCGVRGARRIAASVNSGAGSAARSSLPFGGQRQPLQHHKRRPAPCSPAALAPACAAQPRRHPRRAARRRHHIADEPLAARRILARNHRRLRHTGMPQQRRLDLARLDPEAADLDLRVGAARGTPSTRRRASAPDRRCGTCGCPAARTGRPQTAPPSARRAPDSRAPDRHPQCKARPQPQQAPAAKPAVQNIQRACSRSDAQWNISRGAVTAGPIGDVNGSFSWAIKIFEL